MAEGGPEKLLMGDQLDLGDEQSSSKGYTTDELLGIIKGQDRTIKKQEDQIMNLTARLDHVTLLFEEAKTREIKEKNKTISTNEQAHASGQTSTNDFLKEGYDQSLSFKKISDKVFTQRQKVTFDEDEDYDSEYDLERDLRKKQRSRAKRSSRSKKTNRPELVILESSTSESEGKCGLTSTSSSEEEVTTRRGRARNMSNEMNEMRPLIDALCQRGCPKPEIYSLASGKSFSKFLKTFEAYCSSRYSKTHKDLWSCELGRFLSGELKMVYEAIQGADQPYNEIKRRLLSWTSEHRESMLTQKRNAYRSATYNPDEPLRLFAMRLEYLYTAAYPSQTVIDGKELKRQLLRALPIQIANSLERDMALMKAATGRKPSWRDITALLASLDNTHHRQEPEDKITNKTTTNPWKGAKVNQTTLKTQTRPSSQAQTPPRTSKSAAGNFNLPPPTNRDSAQNSYSNQRKNKSPSIECSWCGKPFHTFEVCRLRLGLCLRCGSDAHPLPECNKPSRYELARQKSRDHKVTQTYYKSQSGGESYYSSDGGRSLSRRRHSRRKQRSRSRSKKSNEGYQQTESPKPQRISRRRGSSASEGSLN